MGLHEIWHKIYRMDGVVMGNAIYRFVRNDVPRDGLINEYKFDVGDELDGFMDTVGGNNISSASGYAISNNGESGTYLNFNQPTETQVAIFTDVISYKSVSFWIYYNPNTDEDLYILTGVTHSDEMYMWTVSSTERSIWLCNEDYYFETEAFNVSFLENGWNHIVATASDSAVKFYINKTEVPIITSYDTVLPVEEFFHAKMISDNIQANSQSHSIKIDQLRFYNRYLPFQDVEALYNEPGCKYQKWSTFLQTPALTSDFPYQCVFVDSTNDITYLMVSTERIIFYGGNIVATLADNIKVYELVSSKWSFYADYSGSMTFVLDPAPVLQSNYDLYIDYDKTSVTFRKTTTDSKLITKRVR